MTGLVRPALRLVLGIAVVVLIAVLISTPAAASCEASLEDQVCTNGTITTNATSFDLRATFFDHSTAGEQFSVEVNVSNTGDQSDTLTVELVVDGQIVNQTTVTVAPGNSQEVTLTTTIEEAGYSNITANDLPTREIHVFDDFKVDTNGDNRVGLLEAQRAIGCWATNEHCPLGLSDVQNVIAAWASESAWP